MPTIYLSPSTQEFNSYLNGGTEEQYMNLLADYMQPYLLSSGIDVVRNSPDMTAASSIRQSTFIWLFTQTPLPNIWQVSCAVPTFTIIPEAETGILQRRQLRKT